jgi:predicted CopG family antitoxin
MTSTVQVKEKTLQMLNEAKKELKAKSHDEVIRKLLLERKKNGCSILSSNPRLTSFTEKTASNFTKCNYT